MYKAVAEILKMRFFFVNYIYEIKNVDQLNN